MLCTCRRTAHPSRSPRVSNPFRAGHCCAPEATPSTQPSAEAFQTPSERGIAVHLGPSILNCNIEMPVSNPFRAGHCCAHRATATATATATKFQTPSERGIAVHRRTTRSLQRSRPVFQTPSERGIAVHGHTGSVDFLPRCVSNPFRAGHCCARKSCPLINVMAIPCFKPLQSGALLCTHRHVQLRQ